MPDVSLTDEQFDRLQEVREDLENAYVGPYGHVRPQDAIEYLLDTYTRPDETDVGPESTEADADGADADGDDSAGGGAIGGEEEATPESTLEQAMNLLDAHDDKWREGSGDEPYEVDLPDGSTEPARTKDDVKRLIFTHWQ